MSLISSLYSGATGLDTTSADLSVIGDNIANSNTVGFKQGRAAFEDALAENLIGATGQRGLGSRLESVQRILSQGALTNTGLATDLAIEGNGFFVVKGSYNGRDAQYLTRAGQFTLDKNGLLVNLQGLHVQGYQADQTGALSATLGDLQVGNIAASPLATTTITMKANLQADAVIPAAWDPTNAAATSNFSSSTTVYDSLGTAHQLQTYFRRTGSGTWEWHTLTDGGGVTGGTAGTPVEVASGTLSFDTSGKLTDMTQTSNFSPVGAATQTLTFNFGDPTLAGGTGLAGITQFAGPSAVSFVSQDGYASGELSSVNVDAAGKVVGSFTNGQSRVLGQVAVATVPAPDQLQRSGGNLYELTPDAGQPSFGSPGQGGRGSVVAGALEQSNVDLASEFVRMITAQRGFQANAKTVTTADSLLVELMNIKR